MFTAQCGVETIVVSIFSHLLVGQDVERFLLTSIEDDLDRVLEVNAHLVALHVLLGLHAETVLCQLSLRLGAEYGFHS